MKTLGKCLPFLVIAIMVFTMVPIGPVSGIQVVNAGGGVRYVDNVYWENEWVSTTDWVNFTDEGPAERRPTGIGGTGTFSEGENVIGFSITLSNGLVLSQCYLAVAPLGGTVVDGVVNPWGPEVNLPSCYGATTPAPAPAAPSASQAPPAATASAPSSGGVINLLDGRSMQSRTTIPDQSGQSPYQDTGLGQAAVYNITVQSGQVVIFGGVTVTVDSVTHNQGYMEARRGPTQLSVTIADGFYVLKTELLAQGEFCARLAQHKMNAWLMSEIKPLDGWAVCW